MRGRRICFASRFILGEFGNPGIFRDKYSLAKTNFMNTMMTWQSRSLSLCRSTWILLGVLFALAKEASAQAQSQQETYSNQGTSEKVRDECREYFNPRFEVRTIADVPLTLLVTKLNDKTTVGPAAGLDALGLWWNISRPQCSEVPTKDPKLRSFAKPKFGGLFSAFLTLNASYTVLSLNDSVKIVTEIPDPSRPGKTLRGTGAKLVERAKPGGYFSLGLGLLYDARWLTRGSKGNRFAIGAMIRYGYFSGRVADKGVFSYGPLLNLSIY